MRIIPLKKSDTEYSCNSYLILGDWNRVEDVNTIIDPGSTFILDEIERLPTGCGKVPVAQIILTHSHFDHTRAVAALKSRYGARVMAGTDGPDVDQVLPDGHCLKAGDDILEVLHTPGHSSDSICLYAPAIHGLFSGDTQLRIRSDDDAYTREYLDGLINVSRKKIAIIYPGHDEPVTGHIQEMLRESLAHVSRSRLNPLPTIQNELPSAT